MCKQIKQLMTRWKALFTAKREEKKHLPSMKELQAEEVEFKKEGETLKKFILKGKKFQKKLDQQKKQKKRKQGRRIKKMKKT